MPPEGVIDCDAANPSEVLGGHSLALHSPIFLLPCPFAFANRNDFFVFKNSWGSQWGNRGWGAMTYDYFDRELYEGWAYPLESHLPRLYGSGIQHVQWTERADSDRNFIFYDIVDVDNDDRLAWAIVVHHRGAFNVEDLYVKPEARCRGFGSKMLSELVKLSKTEATPLRLWIPFADVATLELRLAIQRFLARQGFGFVASPFRSAAFCAEFEGGSTNLPSFDIPPKPAFLFPKRTGDNVNWDNLQKEFGTSSEFTKLTREVFQRHGETLRRLA